MALPEDANSCPSAEYNEETLRIFEEAYECTEEDLKFQFTDDQLKEICLKHKCHVMASRWNIVYEYGLWLKKEGRFEGRSSRYARGMVTKGVNRHKKQLLYDEGEIQKKLEEEWRFRKKDNILSLRMWEREREQQERNECEPQGEDEAHSELSVASMNEEVDQEHSDLDGDIIMMASSSRSISPILSNIEETEFQDSPGNAYEEEHYILEEVDGDPAVMSVEPISTEFIDGDDIELYVEQEFCDQIDTMYTDSRPINEEVCAMFDVNTESMSLTESNAMSLIQSQSENILSDDFNKEIPLTSTQKESEELESGG